MKSENAILNIEELDNLDENLLYLDELENELEEQLDFEIAEFDFLKKEKEKIRSPEALGETIKGVIWEQVMNQVATVAGEDFIKENGGMPLDLSDEAHIQTAENFYAFCEELGLDMSTAINLFIRTCLREKRIPFELSLLNKKSSKNLENTPPSIEELMENLDV